MKLLSRSNLRRALTLLAAFVLLLADLSWLLPGQAAADAPAVRRTEMRESAGSRKTTPSPKPKKTPKPTPDPAAPTATPRATPTPTPFAEPDAVTPSPIPEGPIIEPQAIADWLFAHDFTLPDNFITKKEAQALGWGSRFRNVSDAAPGKSIGGDYFGNYEGKLPTQRGRRYYECDCWYTRGSRNAYRIIFSNDGLVFYTEDHYNTFIQMFPSVPGGGAYD